MHFNRWRTTAAALVAAAVACTTRDAPSQAPVVETPAPRLVGRFEAEVLPSLPPERPVQFVLTNVGESTLAFLDGDHSRNELGRDNHFEFEVRRDDHAQPIRSVFDFGGLAREVVLAPGAEHVFAIDLAHWTACAERGDYAVRGVYRGKMYPPGTLGSRELECDVEVRAEFVLRVR